jgi:hypothetical protein
MEWKTSQPQNRFLHFNCYLGFANVRRMRAAYRIIIGSDRIGNFKLFVLLLPGQDA